MGARVPLDVDLEDKLVFGLSPLRFGYLAMSGLAAMAAWSQRWVPGAPRLLVCLLMLATGVALAWGRWRGRGTDLWLLDGAAFVMTNYQCHFEIRRFRVELDRRSLRFLRSTAEAPPATQWLVISMATRAKGDPG